METVLKRFGIEALFYFTECAANTSESKIFLLRCKPSAVQRRSAVHPRASAFAPRRRSKPYVSVQQVDVREPDLSNAILRPRVSRTGGQRTEQQHTATTSNKQQPTTNSNSNSNAQQQQQQQTVAQKDLNDAANAVKLRRRVASLRVRRHGFATLIGSPRTVTRCIFSLLASSSANKAACIESGMRGAQQGEQ